jgi:hypothetical protein
MTASNRRRRLASRGLRAALLALAALAAHPASSRADPPAAAPSEAQIEAGKALYREARELHRAGKLREAVARSLEAYHAASTPVTSLQAGQYLVEAGRLVEARDIVRSVTLLPPSPRESDKGREARQEAAALAASLDSRIPKVAFAGRPPNVEVSLDGRPLAVMDATGWQGLDPGAHSIVVRAGDRTCTTITVTLTEAEARTIDLHDTAACRTEPSSAAVEAPPEAPPHPAVPAIAAPQASQAEAPRSPAPRAASAGAWKWAGGVVAGAGLVAVGVGSYLALEAKSDYDAVSAGCGARGCTTGAYEARLNARSKADAATVTMIVGGAAVAGGALVFFLSNDAAAPRVGVGLGIARVEVAFAFE